MAVVDVVLDCIVFDLQPSGGISRYWVNLISGLAGLSAGPRLHLLISEKACTESALKVISLARANPRLILYPYKARRLDRVRQPVIPAHLVERAVFHSSYYRTVACMPNVLTIHDFAYENLVGGWPAFRQHVQKSCALTRTSAVVCVSECTRRDFGRRFPTYDGRIEVVLHGVEEYFSPGTAASQGARVQGDYVLFVGKRNYQKNFWCVVEAVKRLKDLRFIIVGPPLGADERGRLDADLGGRYTVRALADDAELIDLYRGAFALAYPSQYEGFGLPVLEAMACGCPAVALGASSIPEVAGDGAILLDEATPESMVSALEKIKNVEVREALINRGLAQAARFSWAHAALQYSALYAAVVQV
jgi:mannosyltransferase